MAERHGYASPGWHKADEGRTLTLTEEETQLWAAAHRDWISDNPSGYLLEQGGRDITLPHFVSCP